MADFNIFSSSTDQQTLNSETGFVAQTGSLAVNGDAISASGFSAITILGSVYSSGGDGIFNDGPLRLDLGPGAYLGGAGYGLFSDEGYVRIRNAGTISGDWGMGLADSDAAGLFCEIINTGEILGTLGGMWLLGGDNGLSSLTNIGSISGGQHGVYSDTDTEIKNLGVIANNYLGASIQHGAFYSVSSDAIDNIKNTGTIDGRIFTNGGEDSVVNAGTVGLVQLGDGNDRYDGNGGFSTSQIRGQDGEDTLKGGAEADIFFGGAGDDTLRGRNGDDELDGDGGRDEIHGNKGDDTLTGGANGDTFVFKASGGFDTVTDFGGNDKIDLKGLGLRRYSKDVRDNIKDVKDGSLVDLSEDYDLVIFLKNVDAGDLSSSDFIL